VASGPPWQPRAQTGEQQQRSGENRRAAQQIAGLVIALSAAVFAGLGFVASQIGEGWPLLALGAGLVVLDVLALELARRVWQREEVIGRV